MIDKEDVKNTVRRFNNYLKDINSRKSYKYDEDENTVIETSKDGSEYKMSPEKFYRGLRFSGWEFVAEKYQ